MRSLAVVAALAVALLMLMPMAMALDGTTVVGRVVDGDGAPIEGALVRCGSQDAWSSADGTFSLPIPDGEDTITVSAEGFNERTMPVSGADLGDVVLEPSASGPSLALIALILACGAGIVALQIHMTRRR